MLFHRCWTHYFAIFSYFLSMQLKVLKGRKITFNQLKTYKYWSGLNTKLWNILIHSLTVTTTSATASFHWGTTVRISIALKVEQSSSAVLAPAAKCLLPQDSDFQTPCCQHSSSTAHSTKAWHRSDTWTDWKSHAVQMAQLNLKWSLYEQVTHASEDFWTTQLTS